MDSYILPARWSQVYPFFKGAISRLASNPERVAAVAAGEEIIQMTLLHMKEVRVYSLELNEHPVVIVVYERAVFYSEATAEVFRAIFRTIDRELSVKIFLEDSEPCRNIIFEEDTGYCFICGEVHPDVAERIQVGAWRPDSSPRKKEPQQPGLSDDWTDYWDPEDEDDGKHHRNTDGWVPITNRSSLNSAEWRVLQHHY